MKKLSQHLKQALAALATADAGEMLTRRQMERVLRNHDEHGGPAVPPRRQVALWAGATLSKAALDYALSACRRLDAGLTVLHAESANPARLRNTLCDAAFRLVALGGRPEDAMRHFIATHSQTAFLILDGDDNATQILSQRVGNPGVPIVVVVAGERAEKTSRRSHPVTPVLALG
ncbi:MAG: hypothetical protein Q8M09_19560 [Pseudomonadota bacterium]|nr:hypothetical protein [Pseudomonadota bacterium]MDP1906415.1 hypothetical protein [Pseudomonadota bacterium]MDP2351450.1 hypothetical protein [Pseudomonadota bacterium]